jgi:C_GCAxxG_C_C family probable redox protein
MNKADRAFSLMSSGRMNCAQTVLTSYAEKYGLERNLALKLSQGFGGGMGRTGSVCGAITAAYMVIGLAQEAWEKDPRQSMEKTYEYVREFNRKFRAIHKSTLCKELLGYDLSKPEDHALARSKQVFTSSCPTFVADAVKILDDILGSD